MLSIIIPTYNEAENIPLLLKEIANIKMPMPHEIIIVDDNSPDKTAEVAKGYTNKYPLRIIVRTKDRGLGAAVRCGFDVAKGKYFAVMDADLSHDPKLLPNMIANLESGKDIVIGTRFHKNSKVEEWTWFRKLTSSCGVSLAKHITGISDPLSGLFMIKRKVITDISLNTQGYKILFEILVKGRWTDIAEIPYTFRMRRFSKSKLNITEYWRFFIQLIRYWR